LLSAIPWQIARVEQGRQAAGYWNIDENTVFDFSGLQQNYTSGMLWRLDTAGYLRSKMALPEDSYGLRVAQITPHELVLEMHMATPTVHRHIVTFICAPVSP
jgi:hypothetical protein